MALVTAGLASPPYDPGPGDWPMFQKDLAHTGSNSSPSWTGEIKRCALIPTSLGYTETSPIVVGDYIFAKSYFYIDCFNRFDGSLVWQGPLPWSEDDINSLSYHHGRVLFAGGAGLVACFNASTGALVWSADVEPTVYGGNAAPSPVVVGDTVYIVTRSRGEVVALDLNTGAVLWRLTKPYSFEVQASPAYDAGRLYFGDGSGRFWAVDVNSHAVVYSVRITMNFLNGSPAVSNGVVYVAEQFGKIFALSTTDGRVLWTFQDPSFGYYHNGPAISGNMVFFAGDGRQLLYLNKATGALLCPPLWTVDNYAHMNPLLLNGHAMLAGCAGGMHHYDPALCKMLYDDGDGCEYRSSIIAKDDTLYAFDVCGNLNIWCPGAPAPSRTPTSTPSATATRTSTVTRTATRTATPTRSPTPSRTATRTATSSRTPTFTRTDTPSFSPTRSPSWTATFTETKTETKTYSPTRTETDTATDSPSRTPSRTGTSTRSPTPSPSATRTPTPSPTDTFTRTWTYTWSPSLSPSPTPSPTGTATYTYTWSRSMTFSLTPSPTATPSRTHTMMPSKTGTRTVTPTRTLTPQGGVEPHAWLTHNQIHPGEGKDCVTVHYLIPDYGKVKVTVYSLLGELVKTLVDLPESRGEHETQWCGENWQGQPVASGIYLIVVETPWFTFKDKAVVIK